MIRFLCFVNFILVVMAQQGERCTTPDNQQGSCVVVFACQPMLDVLQNVPQPLSPQIRQLLKSYGCGFSGEKPKICCPSQPIILNVDDKSQPGSENAPPNVSKHANLKLLPKNCGHLDTTDRIVGGNKTGLFEFPWMALISYQTGRGAEFKCGATIINERYILTAAHCITNLKLKILGVRVGEHNINTKTDCEVDAYGEEICAPPYQDLSIEEVIPHPNYNAMKFTNDIGILRVSPINLAQENSRPVCLPLDKNRNFNFTNRNVIVTGWGYTESGRSSPELLKVELPAIALEECQRKYASITTLNRKQMCAGGKGRYDSCGGDSGGPLHTVGALHGDYRLIQQGIVSFGPRNCGNEPLPGVYTRVASYMNWILDNIKV